MPPHTLPMCLYKETQPPLIPLILHAPRLLEWSPIQQPLSPSSWPNGRTSWSSFMPPLVAASSLSMPQQLEDFLELSSISKWRRMRRILGISWRSPSYLHLVSIEGLQSFKKMALLLARRRATFLGSWRSSSMAPRKGSWKEKKRRR